MKILNIKPTTQWQDESHYHHKMGLHTYEDLGQEMDPYYHILGEVERKHAERTVYDEWRKGTEVKF